MPAIFPVLNKTQSESLENVQKLFTKMILPSSKWYYERLNVLSLPPLALFGENLYGAHFLKILSDEHHQLHSFIPVRQRACCGHSARLKDSILVRSRTTKRQNTFLWMVQPDLENCLLLVLIFYWLETQAVFVFCFLFSTDCFIWCYKHLNSGRINKSVNP